MSDELFWGDGLFFRQHHQHSLTITSFEVAPLTPSLKSCIELKVLFRWAWDMQWGLSYSVENHHLNVTYHNGCFQSINNGFTLLSHTHTTQILGLSFCLRRLHLEAINFVMIMKLINEFLLTKGKSWNYSNHLLTSFVPPPSLPQHTWGVWQSWFRSLPAWHGCRGQCR